MPSQVKVDFVDKLVSDIKGSAHVLVSDYQGLNSEEVDALRKELKAVGARFKVVKNRLALRATEQIGINGLEKIFKGPSAITYYGEDVAAIAKILNSYGKKNQNFKLKGGHLFGSAVDAGKIKEIANLPSREVLIATLASTLNSPLQNLVGTLNEPIRALAAALSSLAKKKESVPAA